MSKKRIPKSKKEIVSDIQLVKDADRRRALIRDILFPYLVEMQETIGYSKVFLQAFSSLVNGVFDESRKTTTISHIKDRLIEKANTLFNKKDSVQKKELEHYLKLIERLNDISIQDITVSTELPRFIDGYFASIKDKGPISDVDINSILGK